VIALTLALLMIDVKAMVMLPPHRPSR